jgi:hypothetical protein
MGCEWRRSSDGRQTCQDQGRQGPSERPGRPLCPPQGCGQSFDGHHDPERHLCPGSPERAVLPELRSGCGDGAGCLDGRERRGHRGRDHQSAGATASLGRQPAQDDLDVDPRYLRDHARVQRGGRSTAGARRGASPGRRFPQSSAGRGETRCGARHALRTRCPARLDRARAPGRAAPSRASIRVRALGARDRSGRGPRASAGRDQYPGRSSSTGRAWARVASNRRAGRRLQSRPSRRGDRPRRSDTGAAQPRQKPRYA